MQVDNSDLSMHTDKQSPSFTLEENNQVENDQHHRWPQFSFGDVVRNVDESIRDPQNSGLERYVGLEHIDPESLHIQRWGLISEGTSFTRRFRKGQVLFGKRRAYQRKVAVAEFDGLCSSDILVFEPKDDRLLPELLPFICQSDGFFEHALDTSAGSLSPRTKFKELARYEFPLPPLDEQRRIAEILWAADEVITKNLVAMQSIARLKNSYEEVAFFNSHNNGNPVLFSEIAEVNPPTKTSCKDEELVSFITMADVSEDGQIINQPKKTYGEVKKGYTVFQEGDILFAKITPCMENGKGAIALNLTNGIGFGSTEFHVLRSKDVRDRAFIFFLSLNKKFRQQARRFMRGTAGQLRVPKNFIEKYVINCLPNASLREEIGKRLLEISNNFLEQKRSIEKTKRVKTELLQKLLGGQ